MMISEPVSEEEVSQFGSLSLRIVCPDSNVALLPPRPRLTD
jgi:hypothetical protein